MKKLFLLFAAGALLTATACTSSDTTTDTTTTDTATTTDAATTTEGQTTTTTDATGTDTGTTGTTTTGDMTTLTNMDDATFMSTAASSNLLEIQAGNLAMQKATDQKVKDYARMMVDHHTKANQELKTVASQMGTTVTEALMPMHQEMLDKLTNHTGSGFDEKYMDAMETAHKMDIAMFEAKSNNAQNPAVKALATKTVPTLRSHHEMATSIEDTVD